MDVNKSHQRAAQRRDREVGGYSEELENRLGKSAQDGPCRICDGNGWRIGQSARCAMSGELFISECMSSYLGFLGV